jgi:hypothetical protein
MILASPALSKYSNRADNDFLVSSDTKSLCGRIPIGLPFHTLLDRDAPMQFAGLPFDLPFATGTRISRYASRAPEGIAGLRGYGT